MVMSLYKKRSRIFVLFHFSNIPMFNIVLFIHIQAGNPIIRDIHPRTLSVEGGTTLSVEGTNFTTESQPQMNITQLPITVNSSDGSKTFDKIEYPQTSCMVRDASEMTCKTPKLRLPSLKNFGSFKAEYRFGFLFRGFEKYQELEVIKDNMVTNSIEIEIIELPPIAEQNWPSCDVTKIEPLNLQIAWGKFQHEVMVNVGGHSSNISQRYVNRIKFLPPGDDVIVLDQNAGCAPESFSVEVQAGNTNRHVGCLTYVDSKGQHLTIILMMVASVFVTLVIISVIACCVIRKGKKNSYTPNMELDTIGEKC